PVATGPESGGAEDVGDVPSGALGAGSPRAAAVHVRRREQPDLLEHPFRAGKQRRGGVRDAGDDEKEDGDQADRHLVHSTGSPRGGRTPMTPPFRAEHIGSLLRPRELHEARARARVGAMTTAGLREVEDRCIRQAVAKQESLGLRVVTDGELRRDFWHLDFLRQLEGVALAPVTGMVFQAEDVPPMPTVTSRLFCAGPIMVDHFTFLKSLAHAVPKLTIPAPAMLHLRGGRRAISREHYPDLAEFWADAAAAYRVAIGPTPAHR